MSTKLLEKQLKQTRIQGEKERKPIKWSVEKSYPRNIHSHNITALQKSVKAYACIVQKALIIKTALKQSSIEFIEAKRFPSHPEIKIQKLKLESNSSSSVAISCYFHNHCNAQIRVH